MYYAMGMNTEFGKHGVVVAGDEQTARAGARMLAQGGNSVDAAVAAGMAAFVCEIALCGPLGGGVLVNRQSHGEMTAVDFFARIPGLGLSRQPDVEFGDAVIDFGVTTQTFKVGRGAAALGLALPGLIDSHRKWGKLPLHVVVEPAVELGRQGFVVGEQMAYILSLIAPIFAYTPESKRLIEIDGRLPENGESLANAQLAGVLEDIGRDPKRVSDLYSDLRTHFGVGHGGFFTDQDMRDYAVDFLEPISVPMGEWSLSTMPAPSSGGALIALGLRLLEGVSKRVDFMSLEHLVEVVTTQRLLLDVRTPDFDAQVHDRSFVEQLLSDESVRTLQNCLGRMPGDVHDNHLGSTTQISALDGNGGVTSLTLTNGEGCGVVLPGTGIEVNNLLGEEDINPRGFHVDPAGMHMSTMMAPTIGVGPGGDLIALGSGGSNVCATRS